MDAAALGYPVSLGLRLFALQLPFTLIYGALITAIRLKFRSSAVATTRDTGRGQKRRILAGSVGVASLACLGASMFSGVAFAATFGGLIVTQMIATIAVQRALVRRQDRRIMERVHDGAAEPDAMRVEPIPAGPTPVPVRMDPSALRADGPEAP